MTSRRFAFRVEYEGTGLHGWQSQPELPTVQGHLETAAAAFLGQPASIRGASRTDAGVHARDQIAALTHTHPVRPSGFCKAINNRLPAQIAIRDAVEVELDFSPTAASRGKIYVYRIYQSRIRWPLLDRYTTRVIHDLDLKKMREAAHHLIGRQDFEAFAARDHGRQSTIRTISEIQISQMGPVIELRVGGDGFLKQMVRNIAGTLLDVARDRTPPNEILTILASKDRTQAGPTAPARGLELEKMLIEWPPKSLGGSAI